MMLPAHTSTRHFVWSGSNVGPPTPGRGVMAHELLFSPLTVENSGRATHIYLQAVPGVPFFWNRAARLQY